ncbi:response regulator [Deinococcus aetherius]|uniref:Response regulator n=1 Tax=Deinococcus aetherius TaxID=200252 RepID=A0ABN6RGZ2_9DEIO|nr:response regulator [Deinococcus aetherius]BDP42625.1 response regulator [Deinococcus aetherius]
MHSASSSVLLVEDNEAYSYLTRRLLQSINPALDVHVARDGEEALAFFRRHRPRLVLLDLVVPSPSGLELLQAMKGNEETAHLPVIVLSGHGDDRRVWSAYHQYANAFLIKPDAPDDLHAALVALNDFWFKRVLPSPGTRPVERNPA